jgi:hypothetical protein
MRLSRPGAAAIVALTAAFGCAVDVASLKIAAPRPIAADVISIATSRGWREGESCRFWLLGVPFGLPQVDEAMNEALRPVNGAFMEHVNVRSVHAVYVLFGWHCYRVRGEVFA